MKRFRNLLTLFLAVVGLLLVGTAAKADTLTLALDSAFQTGPAGVFDFTGTIDYTAADATNDGGATEYLNGDSPFVSGGTLDDSPFNNNAPLSMNPMDSTPDIDIFNVITPAYIDGPASLNTYTGYFTIVGGQSQADTDPSVNVLSTVDFEIVVTPEPPSWELLAMALMGLLGMMLWSGYRSQAAAV